jgi:hypothetical protein
LALPPGYAQQRSETPHASQGQLLHDGEAKKLRHLPWTHTSSVAQVLPHVPQCSELEASSTCVRHAPLQFVWLIAPQVVT